MEPLANKLRPKDLTGFFGQEELVGPKSFLFKAISNDLVPSLIFWGPPGSGKTTLAKIIASQTKAEFVELSATSGGVSDLRKLIDKAETDKRLGIKTVLFIDEIHRWNKSQQDSLLPFVERGTVTLIGATTENPSFELNSALLSRLKVVVLKSLSVDSLKSILNKAISTITEQKLLTVKKVDDKALDLIIGLSSGDARTALNILESALKESPTLNLIVVKKVSGRQRILYDKNGEEHYNLISALHKSMRGGDANGSLYWLARLMVGGEDPKYVARRLVRFASEDIGLANHSALLLANAVFESCLKLGMPECQVHLAQAVVYLARSKKDVSVYLAYNKAREVAEKTTNLGVPLHLRNAPTKLMKDLDYGKNYKYTPLVDSSKQKYLPEDITGEKFIS